MGMIKNKNLHHSEHLFVIAKGSLSDIRHLQLKRQGATVRQAGVMPIHVPLVLLVSFIKSAVMSSVFKGVSPCVVGKYITPHQYFARGAGMFLSMRRSITGFSSRASLVFSIYITTLGVL
jgi:hypothetical protein